MASSESGGNRTRAESIQGIERATGRSWDEIVAEFDAAGAREMRHPEIAKLARRGMPEALKNPDWWAQAVSIAYEQHVGLRVPGQSSTGAYRVSASRTIEVDRDAAIDAFVRAHGERTDHLGHAPSAARPSRTEKRTFWRFSLDGAGKVEVSATPKGDGRSSLTISHDGLTTPDDIENWRAHWKALLAEL